MIGEAIESETVSTLGEVSTSVGLVAVTAVVVWIGAKGVYRRMASATEFGRQVASEREEQMIKHLNDLNET